jgi:threonine aldolase
VIELRSDTFTRPTARMRAAMAAAVVGDDVYGEDPTVARLESVAAARLGKSAACLMPSGTMANLAALMAHVPRGGGVIVGAESDIYLYEAGGASVCGGATYLPVPNQPDGTLAVADLRAAFPDDPDDPQFAVPALICLENTQNRCGGVVLPAGYPQQVAAVARDQPVPVHLDGARLFNAAVASGAPVAQLAQHADSVQFCLSKGLGAPIGSILVGGDEFIARARRIRKMLGGGMRQAGVIAAAGIVALDEMVDRLGEDHAHARRLAAGLATIAGVSADPATVQTNIVLFTVTHPGFTWQSFVAALRGAGVAVDGFGHGRIRAVTHVDVTAADIDRALEVIDGVLTGAAAEPAIETAA